MGLVFIWAGVLGMLLLLGFIAMHLLGAAIASLLYLLLAPAAVLAPALGDGGRAAFRGWATRLLGAVMAKLIYSFVLGVILADAADPDGRSDGARLVHPVAARIDHVVGSILHGAIRCSASRRQGTLRGVSRGL